jgi:LPS-assembly lipoprotein
VTARIALFLFLALLLGACGWQLRGSGGNHIEGREVYVELRANAELLARQVERGLTQSGARIVDTKEAAEAILVVLSERVSRRTIAVDRTARAREYELSYRVQFQLETSNGDLLRGPETVSAQGNYRFDREDVAGTESRERDLEEDLRRDAVRLLLARVQAALAQLPKED